jgi:parallel beta-helix repeat protein
VKSKALIILAITALLSIALSAWRLPGSLAVGSLLETEELATKGKPSAPAQQTSCNSCADCSDKLTSGTYVTVTLTTDLVDVAGYCVVMVFGESNVVFDCDGHTIDGDDIAIDGDGGIAMFWGTNNKIINCTVSDFHSGIYLAGATNHTIVDNATTSNGVGIDLRASDSSTIQRCTSTANYTGIRLTDSENNAIDSNVVCDNIVLDFDLDESSTGSTGDNNICDQPGSWNDEGATGCSFGCDVQHIYLPIALRNH